MPEIVDLIRLAIVLAIIYWIFQLLPLPQPANNIILACVLLLLLMWVVFGVAVTWHFR